ncbi:MAG: HAMP domain-containing histidine kinase [Acidobacteriia bacterium]|nr:HAMP domain-containing histidine kinase [Terriglobia bacterium]
MMDPDQIRRRAPVLWLFMALLVVLVCVLAVLQYRWIGELSVTEEKQLQYDLQAAANKLSSSFNAELSAAAEGLQPSEQQVQEMGRQKAYERRYSEWHMSAAHPRLFRRAAMVGEENGRLALRMFNPETGALELVEWPADWIPWREFVALRLSGVNSQRPENSPLIDYPRFRNQPDPGSGRQEELEWLLLDVDAKYVSEVILPELLTQQLGDDFRSQYRVEVSVRADPSKVIFGTDSGRAPSSGNQAPATATLFDPPRPPRNGASGQTVPVRGVSNDSGRGRWMLSVWLRDGSLEAIVAKTRRRDLAISGGVLLLMLATGAALAQFSRRAQQLAQVEMEFVAGVSHELRTPLTVIRTAAFNLRGKVATNPSQVERYGALIQQESERLGAIVEQVLRFAGAKAGRVVQERQPVSVAGLIEGTLQSNKGMLEDALCEVQTHIEPGLPPISGDSLALRHALQNLLANAAKYGGAAGRQSVEISARAVRGATGNKAAEIEIRVADRGMGIPPEEQKHVFDAFFRGRKAVEDQIHGTGLGLHLVKRIVEAHGGTVSLESEPGAGSTFIVRIPAAPAEHQDELAHSLG